MKEKDFQVLFGKYLKENPPNKTEVYELKICKQKSMPFDRVNPHQIEALEQAQKGNLYHKISDTGFPMPQKTKMRFAIPKPFDCLNIFRANAYIVIWFYKPRQPKEFIFIDVRSFRSEAWKSERKSLTEKRAKEIAVKVIEL